MLFGHDARITRVRVCRNVSVTRIMAKRQLSSVGDAGNLPVVARALHAREWDGEVLNRMRS